jgi:hypothetical protein
MPDAGGENSHNRMKTGQLYYHHDMTLSPDEAEVDLKVDIGVVSSKSLPSSSPPPSRGGSLMSKLNRLIHKRQECVLHLKS